MGRKKNCKEIFKHEVDKPLTSISTLNTLHMNEETTF